MHMKYLFSLSFCLLLFHAGCGTSSKSPGMDKAIEKGYNCIGTEPFWNVKVEKTGITFHLIGEEPVQYPYQAVQQQGATAVYETTLKNSRLKLMITEAGCSDGMSDAHYPFTVSVEKDGQTYQGCAFLIGQNPMQGK